jgi:hypothetical protein
MAGERVGRLPVEEARRAAAEAGISEMMADLSVFQIVLHDQNVAAASTGC